MGKKNEDIFSSSKLSKVTQLTGFSDPIYAEAYVDVNQYDIVLDVLIGMFFCYSTVAYVESRRSSQCKITLSSVETSLLQS
jgi:hypothetical protein